MIYGEDRFGAIILTSAAMERNGDNLLVPAEASYKASEFLGLVFDPWDVFEIRILNCPKAHGGTFLRTAAGYFNDIGAARSELVRVANELKPPAIYVTLNPVNPELMARSPNVINWDVKHTAEDRDIVSRRLFMIDIDPKRPKGVSSTAAEMLSALDLANAIRSSLANSGWPDPIRTMSGNGGYLLYKIDAPNDEETKEIIRNALHSIRHRFPNEGNEVDCSTFNAARICQVPGLWKRKGSEYEGRVHRRSWFIAPDRFEAVPIEKIRELAAAAPSKPANKVTHKGFEPRLIERARAYLAKISPAISGQGGSKQTLEAACGLYRFGLDDNAAMLLLREYSDRCEPAWEEFELAHKLRDARAKVEAAGEFGKLQSENRTQASHSASQSEPMAGDICEPIDFFDLREGDNPQRGNQVINGVLRDGEVCFVGAVSKAGKSWFIANLIWCFVTGKPWLGMDVRQGKVLLVDNELKRREIDWRLNQVAMELQHFPERGELTVWPIRGQQADVYAVVSKILAMDLTGYSAIFLDAIYKLIPDGKSENDNEAMGKLMNALQRLADETGVAVFGVHHATKGDQADKSTLDILSGAGSFGRSLDSMIALRDHEQDGLNVVEFRTRTNRDPEPLSAKFEFPLWQAVTVAPERRSKKRSKPANDELERAELLEAIPLAPDQVQLQKLRNDFGFGYEKTMKLLRPLIKKGTISKNETLNGKKTETYFSRVSGQSKNESE